MNKTRLYRFQKTAFLIAVTLLFSMISEPLSELLDVPSTLTAIEWNDGGDTSESEKSEAEEFEFEKRNPVDDEHWSKLNFKDFIKLARSRENQFKNSFVTDILSPPPEIET